MCPLLLLSSNRTYCTTLRTLNTRMCNHLVQMVSYRRLCDWAYVALARLEHIWVIGWENGGRCADDGAEGVVHLLGLGLVEVALQYGTRGCSSGGGGHGRMRGEVVVVVGGCAYYWAL